MFFWAIDCEIYGRSLGKFWGKDSRIYISNIYVVSVRYLKYSTILLTTLWQHTTENNFRIISKQLIVEQTFETNFGNYTSRTILTNDCYESKKGRKNSRIVWKIEHARHPCGRTKKEGKGTRGKRSQAVKKEVVAIGGRWQTRPILLVS